MRCASVGGVTDYHGQLLEFAVRMLLDASSPSNYLAANPELLALTQAEQGQNLVRGFEHWIDDLGRTLKGAAPPAPRASRSARPSA